MLKAAFNALTRFHSRPATLKRLGTVDIFSPTRITPSNYFRFLRGPEYTTVAANEYIIPVDATLGQYAQKFSFSGIPSTGDFKIKYGATTVGPFDSTAVASDIQTALRTIPGMTNVVVTGSFNLGFTVTFVGFSTSTALGIIEDNTLETNEPETVDVTVTNTNTAWQNGVQKGDRVVTEQRLYVVDEVIEMYDLGGTIMGYRCRME